MSVWRNDSNPARVRWVRESDDGVLRLTVWPLHYPTGWVYLVANETRCVATGAGFRTAELACAAADDAATDRGAYWETPSTSQGGHQR